jgi:hypothetical protein
MKNSCSLSLHCWMDRRSRAGRGSAGKERIGTNLWVLGCEKADSCESCGWQAAGGCGLHAALSISCYSRSARLGAWGAWVKDTVPSPPPARLSVSPTPVKRRTRFATALDGACRN